MKYIILISTLFLINCNSNNQKANQTIITINDSKCYSYPHLVDSLHFKDLYDTARWYIYTRYCDVLYQPKSDSLLSKPFSELELRLSNCNVSNDTVTMIFDFMDNEQAILPSMLREYRQLATGIGFNIKTRQKIFAICSSVYIKYGNNPKNRFENPMQPEVINYIKTNWDKLNICFRELAIQNGLMGVVPK